MKVYIERGLVRKKKVVMDVDHRKKEIDWTMVKIAVATLVLLPFVALVFYVSLPHPAKADEMHYTAVIKEGSYLSPKTFCNSL